MSTYEPGTVAVATVRGVPNVRIWRTPFSNWVSERAILQETAHVDRVVTDIRPLVVLDLDGYDGERAVTYLRNLARESRDVFDESPSPRGKLANLIADQIEQQKKPPRIPEPGLWGVVEAGVKEHDQRLRWVRLGDNYRPDDRGEYDRLWCDLIDPTLIRPGIEATS
jgi:hypothetical protein